MATTTTARQVGEGGTKEQKKKKKTEKGEKRSRVTFGRDRRMDIGERKCVCVCLWVCVLLERLFSQLAVLMPCPAPYP